MFKVIKWLARDMDLVGSRDICPEKSHYFTDTDYLVLANWFTRPCIIFMIYFRGFARCFGGTYSHPYVIVFQLKGFQVWKNRDKNIDILLTVDKVFHRKFKLAHAHCKSRAMSSKADRLVVFQKYLYGNIVTAVETQKWIDDKSLTRIIQ